MLHLETRGVDVLGPLVGAVAAPRRADQSRHRASWSQLVPLALVVAMVCIMQTAAVASAFPLGLERARRYQPRLPSGSGRAAFSPGMVGSFAVDSSPPSTAIVRDFGGRSQIASLTAVALMIALALLASGAMADVLCAALAGILVYIAMKIFRVGEMVSIRPPWRAGDLGGVEASAALVVGAPPIESGMLLATATSFVHSLYIVARPYCAELAWSPGTTVWWPPSTHDQGEHEPGVMVFAPAAPLNFTNVQDIVGRIRKAIANRRPPVKLLLIQASGIIDIDYTGSQLLRRAILELKKRLASPLRSRASPMSRPSAKPAAAGLVRERRQGPRVPCRSRRRCASSDRRGASGILDRAASKQTGFLSGASGRYPGQPLTEVSEPRQCHDGAWGRLRCRRAVHG